VIPGPSIPPPLARLDQLGGPGFGRRIIDIFLSEAPRRMADAGHALERQDGPGLAHAVHSLISSGGNVGAMGLASLAREMERDAEAARWEQIPQKMARLTAAFATVSAELARQREGTAGT
jgi:two-component system sensor histidine kinase/response regulator